MHFTLNFRILLMMQAGLLNTWKQQFWPTPNECTASKSSKTKAPKALQLRNLYGHFLILGFGYISACIVFFIEKFLFYYRKYSQRI